MRSVWLVCVRLALSLLYSLSFALYVYICVCIYMRSLFALSSLAQESLVRNRIPYSAPLPSFCQLCVPCRKE